MPCVQQLMRVWLASLGFERQASCVASLYEEGSVSVFAVHAALQPPYFQCIFFWGRGGAKGKGREQREGGSKQKGSKGSMSALQERLLRNLGTLGRHQDNQRLMTTTNDWYPLANSIVGWFYYRVLDRNEYRERNVSDVEHEVRATIDEIKKAEKIAAGMRSVAGTNDAVAECVATQEKWAGRARVALGAARGGLAALYRSVYMADEATRYRISEIHQEITLFLKDDVPALPDSSAHLVSAAPPTHPTQSDAKARKS